jgi:transposase, IS30 family
MTKKPKISATERDQIGLLLASGVSLSEIARRLGRSKSSISHEVNANSKNGIYQPILANCLSRERNTSSRKTNAAKDPAIYYNVIDKLRYGWSPEQIAGRLKKKCHGKCVISYETIYRYVYSPEGRKQNLKEYLPRAHKKRFPKHYRKSYRRGISNRVSISLRPEEVNNRTIFGHWEADVVEGKGHSGGIQTLLERKTRYYQARLIPNIDSEYGIKAQKSLLSKVPQQARYSVTFDNGRENYNHYQLTRDLDTKTYFCDPYAAWQKGAIENHNGVLRRYIPKKSDLTKLPQWELDFILEEINNRPRKCLNYTTPKEAFIAELKTLLSSKCSDSF